ncbi:MAG TPA: YegS/Rv2252/BmrU family lipid kinase [Bacteroidales bacterium]|nr:YegS/Rv2252/BmrU family lipid kinase [Bacteroidales bacterium]
MKRVLCIKNPIAGRRRIKLDKSFIERHFPIGTEIEFVVTQAQGEASLITEQHLNDFDFFIAIGGDGTVNEVGKILIGTDKVLGILPAGSGNGLARELGMNMNLHNAVKQLAEFNITSIDTISVNSYPSLNVAGIGFEAEVAHLFKTLKRRGFPAYAKCVARLISEYKPVEVELLINGEKVIKKAFSLSFANSRQFGNNVFNSPLAGFNDGLIDVSVIKPFPLILAPELSIRLLDRSLHKSWYYEVVKTEKTEILNQGEMRWHIDGDPIIMNGPVEVEIKKQSLKVLMGNENRL